MIPKQLSRARLYREVQELRFRLVEAEKVLDTLRQNDGQQETNVGAKNGQRYTPQSAERLYRAMLESLQMKQTIQANRSQLVQTEERIMELQSVNDELTNIIQQRYEFLINMSREMRTALNAILGRSEVLKEGVYGALTTQQISTLQGIDESGQYLVAMLNDLIDLSQIDRGDLDLHYDEIKVNLACQMSLHMVMQSAVKKQIALTSTIDRDVALLYTDGRYLKQLLVHLLANAIKWTPEGGVVGLEVTGDVRQHTLTFTVWDSGSGIAQEDLPTLFEPFAASANKLSPTGNGLGLALIWRLTHLLYGTIAVESTPGKGTHFRISLPWHEARAEPAAPAMHSTDLPIKLLQQALVIDDSESVADQFVRYFGELGVDVDLQTQANGTIERAATLQPDVILLDIMLPDEPGWKVLRQLKANPRTRGIPVIIVSQVDQYAYGRALGAAGYLVKPVDRAALVGALRQVVVLPNQQVRNA